MTHSSHRFTTPIRPLYDGQGGIYYSIAVRLVRDDSHESHELQMNENNRETRYNKTETLRIESSKLETSQTESSQVETVHTMLTIGYVALALAVSVALLPC